MVHDLSGTLAILLAVLTSSTVIAALVGFLESAAVGWRTFLWVLPLCALLGLLQAVESPNLPWALSGYALLITMIVALRRSVRKRRGKRLG